MNSEIVVVSGLPRSGTSLMMQMLDRGGMPTLTDQQRGPDENNPRGYFELELVKSIKADASWIAGARNKAVKIVSLLLFDLPPSEQYRIVLMKRNLEEIVASQTTMLARENRQGVPAAKLQEAFKTHLRVLDGWLAAQANFQVLPTEYAAVIAQPREQARRVNEFLGRRLDEKLMASAVDPLLYRNKAAM